MNSYERVFAALNLEQPDRVPIFEGAIADNIVELLIPGGDYLDVVEKYDLDAIYLREDYHYEPVDREKNYHRDEWGIVMKLEGEAVHSPVQHPIKNEADLEAFIPPSARATNRLARHQTAIKRFKGQKPIVLGMSDAFAIPWKLRGMSEFLLDMAMRPDFVKKIIKMVVDYNCELIQAAADIGVDIIRCTDDYAFNSGPMFSPKMWREFVQPGLRQLVETAHGRDLKFVKHCDGLIHTLVEPMLETGIDGLHPIEPLPGQSLAEYKEKFGHRVCLMGNVDCKNVLTKGSREEVIKDVRRCMREGAANGGYMIASSNAIHRGSRPENFIWYVTAALEIGEYPISI
jgi:uroporphyrinogen decarboxylase